MVSDYTINNSDFDKEESSKTIQSFFKIKAELIKRELRWKGLDFVNGRLERISEPIAPDYFISALINTIASIMGEHNVLTNKTPEEVKVILMEKYVAFINGCLREPFFNWELFPLIKEEFDHSLQLFLSFAQDGWGAKTTTSLQAGVVAEQTYNEKVEENPFLRMAKKVYNKKGDLNNVLEEESQRY